MRIDQVTVNVNAKLDVDEKTAEACLKLVEIYINNHKEIRIQGQMNEDGTETYTFVKMGTEYEKTCPVNNAPCNECVPGAPCAKLDAKEDE